MRGIVLFLVLLLPVITASAQRECVHLDYKEQLIRESAAVRKKHDESESFTLAVQRGINLNSSRAIVPSVIVIPVVVHIVYHHAQDNISDEQVKSQIDALNRDFSGTNIDKINIPEVFSSLAADCGIQFRLASTDPAGYKTSGITRRKTDIKFFGLDDRIKNTARGGADAWDANRYLNIWVCKIAGGVLGYSSVPGAPPNKDGVVISNACFGTTANVGGYFNKGRTATHEIGHWLNLKHIWGDTYCGDDKVDDTPKQTTYNRGCPQGKTSKCDNKVTPDMYMNFMDLTNDACMNMFTKGQRERMRALFFEGGARASLLSSPALDTTTLTLPPPVMAESMELSLYPNPSTDFISIDLKGTAGSMVTAFTIYDRYGQPVLKDKMQSTKKQVAISSLKPGVYYLHVAGRVSRFMKL